jgi:hypothetical protein
MRGETQMTCDKCGVQMNYAFYINNYYWQKVVGEEKFDKNVGRWCAHCTLEILGGASWYITWNEPVENIRSYNGADAVTNRGGPNEM